MSVSHKLLLCACLVGLNLSVNASTQPETRELLKIIENLSKRVAVLESREARGPNSLACDNKFPILAEPITYSGCNRNMIKNTTQSIETCQNGTVTMYNTSTTSQTGLFDAHIDVNNAGHDIYHFLCTYTEDEPHTASCTLTYEVPHRAQGPAFITIRFKDVQLASRRSGHPEETCLAGAATITGNYFYDSEMVAAGAYSFYAPARTQDQAKRSPSSEHIMV